jgi:beta-lactamase superfamily II metal-dependent hydrolase
MKLTRRIEYEYEVLNVGDADAIIIRQFINDQSYVILIDAGHEEDAELIKNQLMNYYGSHINLAICTHPDSDHKDGFFGLINDEDITIDELWLSDPDEILTCEEKQALGDEEEVKEAIHMIWQKSGNDELNLINLALRKGIQVYSVIDGAFDNDLHIQIVGPTAEYYKEAIKNMINDNLAEIRSREEIDEEFAPDKEEDPSPSNATSLIVLFVPGNGKKLLFTGDANTDSLEEMLYEYEDLRNVYLLKVPHHGSRYNLTKNIIRALSPKTSIISASDQYGHPNNEVADYLARYGDVYSTHILNSNLYGWSEGMTPRKGIRNAEPYRQKRVLRFGISDERPPRNFFPHG